MMQIDGGQRIYCGVVFFSGMLEVAVLDWCRPRVIWNRAFMTGSSKQGNARRASVGENCVVAKYLHSKKKHTAICICVSFQRWKQLLLSDSVFNVRRTVEAVQFVVQLTDKIHGNFVKFAHGQRFVTSRYDEKLPFPVLGVRFYPHRSQFHEILNLLAWFIHQWNFLTDYYYYFSDQLFRTWRLPETMLMSAMWRIIRSVSSLHSTRISTWPSVVKLPSFR